MTNPKTIIFDLDGTLIHSAPDLHAATNAALDTVNRTPISLETVISFIGDGVEKLIERAVDATGGGDIKVRRSLLAAFLDAYGRDLTTLSHPYPGVLACLERLADAGVALGICTNKPQGPAQDVCDAMNLSRYFDVIMGALPDVAKKPDAAPLLNAIKQLGGVPEQSLYIGDSRVDFETAKAAGVPFHLFTQGYMNGPRPDLPARQCFDTWVGLDLLRI